METGGIENLQLAEPRDQAKSKSINKGKSYEDKLSTEFETNIKLKELMQTIKSNSLAKKIQASQVSENNVEQQNMLTLKKRQGKLMAEIQHLTNSLNCLINDNNKLKAQVDSSRSSRVIYSNVYKNLQKEIHRNQYLYKCTLIDFLCYEETETKIKEKIEKTIRKIEREINELQGGFFNKKKEKRRINRVDTGLSSLRDSKMNSKDTKRGSSRANYSNSMMETIREEEDATSKKQVAENAVSKENNANAGEESLRSQVQAKARVKAALQEQISEYYDLQMKSSYYDNMLAQLQKICGGQTLDELGRYWKSVDKEIEEEYKKYLQTEENMRQLDEEMRLLQKEGSKAGEKDKNSDKTAEQLELSRVEEELEKEKAQLTELEAELTDLMDLNCHRLSDEEIGNHIMRIKRRGVSNSKELDKLLESAVKQKSNRSSLASSALSHVK